VSSAPSQTGKTPPPAQGEKSGDAFRSVVSLILVVHLFCVAVALTSNLAPSPLQERLVTVLAPYLQLVNLDLNYTPYYLTHETSLDTDHWIEVLPRPNDTDSGATAQNGGPADADAQNAAAQDAAAQNVAANVDDAWFILTDEGLRGSDRRHRYQRFAKILDIYSDREQLSSLIAEQVVIFSRSRLDIDTMRIRCRRLELQTPEALRPGSNVPQNPFDPSYFRTAYDAHVVRLPSGAIILNRVEARGEVAPPTSTQE